MDLDTEIKAGKKRALYLLSQRALLSSDLIKKLQAKAFSEAAIAAVIAFCEQAGYINDAEQVAQLIAKELKKGRSPRWVYLKLKQKGVDEALLHSLCRTDIAREKEALERLLHKYAPALRRSGPDAWQKWAQKLCRQGFSYESVVEALRRQDLFS